MQNADALTLGDETGIATGTKHEDPTSMGFVDQVLYVAKSQIFGYQTTVEALQQASNVAILRKKIILFLVFFLMLGIETFFRAIDIQVWMYIGPLQDPLYTLDSKFDPTFSPKYARAYPNYGSNGPIGMLQVTLCMIAMAINSFAWQKGDKLTYNRHVLHYYLASLINALVMPTPESLYITKTKWSFLVVTNFLFQSALAMHLCPAGLHQFVSCTASIFYLVQQFKTVHNVVLKPICVWDSYFHIILPVFLTLSLSYFKVAEQMKREYALKRRNDDLTNIVDNLPQGLALTEHLHKQRVKFTEQSIGVVNKSLAKILERAVPRRRSSHDSLLGPQETFSKPTNHDLLTSECLIPLHANHKHDITKHLVKSVDLRREQDLQTTSIHKILKKKR